MKYTLHTHTVQFDGKNTIQEMVNRARFLGFDTIGISNHFIVNPKIKDAPMYYYAKHYGYSNIYSSDFDEAKKRFIPHYQELERVREQNPDMRILRGMEVDFFDNEQWCTGFNDTIKLLKPDYLIGSTHFVEYGGKLLNTHDWMAMDKSTQNEILRIYWENLKRATESGLFTWMAHLDLPKKAGLGREKKWEKSERAVVRAASQTNTAIEINTSFYRDNCYEPYPSNRILKMMSDYGVSTIISDDAHNVANIGRHFDEARHIIREIGLKTTEKVK